MSDVEQWEHDEQRAMENEIISLREQVATLTKERNAFQNQCIRLKNERAVEKGQLAALAEQNEKMRETLQELYELLPVGVGIAALSLPNLATPVLNKIKAEAYREAAEICETTFAHGVLQIGHRAAIAKAIRAKADELENTNG